MPVCNSCFALSGNFTCYNGAWVGSPRCYPSVPVGNVYTFGYTGAISTFTVPCLVSSISIDVRGAQGGSSASGVGRGARMTGTFAISGGTVNVFSYLIDELLEILDIIICIVVNSSECVFQVLQLLVGGQGLIITLMRIVVKYYRKAQMLSLAVSALLVAAALSLLLPPTLL